MCATDSYNSASNASCEESRLAKKPLLRNRDKLFRDCNAGAHLPIGFRFAFTYAALDSLLFRIRSEMQ